MTDRHAAIAANDGASAPVSKLRVAANQNNKSHFTKQCVETPYLYYDESTVPASALASFVDGRVFKDGIPSQGSVVRFVDGHNRDIWVAVIPDNNPDIFPEKFGVETYFTKSEAEYALSNGLKDYYRRIAA